jgi:hypothetical protein
MKADKVQCPKQTKKIAEPTAMDRRFAELDQLVRWRVISASYADEIRKHMKILLLEQQRYEKLGIE